MGAGRRRPPGARGVGFRARFRAADRIDPAAAEAPARLPPIPQPPAAQEELLGEEPGVVSDAGWHKGVVGEYYRCADCGELHSQFDEDAGKELRLDDLEPPDEP